MFARRRSARRRRFLRIVAPASAALLLLGACTTSDSRGAPDGVEVFDISEILEGDIVVEPQPDGTAALLRATTTVEAICSVVYGTTPSFGMQATDDDMSGVGHEDHRPVMRGLEPDTEYFYRLQGSTADGRLFASEVFTFRTPAAEPVGGGRENVALEAAVLDVSSEFSAAFAAVNAFDGDLSTEWSSAGDGDDAYVVFDLGRAVEASGIGFRTREMSDGTSIVTSFTVTIDEGEPLGPFEAGPGLAVAEVTFTGRIVRIDVETSTGGNTGAIEIEVYGR
jgi:phosphodiesterase/alkaline phosphatase D-like protein